MKKEHLFSRPGVSPDGHVAESTGFVRATTDTAFKIMLSDDRIAEALISDIFRDIKIMDKPTKIKIIGKGETKIPLQGKRSNAVMDYHAIINNRDHVIIEMQILRHNNFDKRVLFYAASTFANQEFEGGSEWHSQIKNVYAIQFLDYSTLGDGNFRKYYCVTDKYSGRDLEGIFLIQIELAGIGEIMSKMSQEKALTAAEWWYYVIENSEKLTENEILEYQNIGMPGEITDALDKLKFSGWNSGDREVYEGEVEEADTYIEELERNKIEGRQEGLEEGIKEGIQKGLEEGIQKGVQKGEVIGQIKGLLERFWDDEPLAKPLQRMEKHSLSEEFVEKIWNEYAKKEEISPGKNLEDFLQLLKKEDLFKGE